MSKKKICYKYRLYPNEVQKKYILKNIEAGIRVYSNALWRNILARFEDLSNKFHRITGGEIKTYVDKNTNEVKFDMSYATTKFYEGEVIRFECEKYGVTPIMKTKKNEDGEVESTYIDNKETEHLLLETVAKMKNVELPIKEEKEDKKDTESPNNKKRKKSKEKKNIDYKKLKKILRNEHGISFEFDFTAYPDIKVTDYTENPIVNKNGEIIFDFKEVDSIAISQTIRNLNTAFSNISKMNAGYPNYKKLVKNKMYLTGGYKTSSGSHTLSNIDTSNILCSEKYLMPCFNKENVSDKYMMIWLPGAAKKIGKENQYMKFRYHRPFPDGCKISDYYTIEKETDGNYYIVFTVEVEETNGVSHKNDNVIGIDLSIGKSVIIDSNGKEYGNHDFMYQNKEKLAKLQRQLDKMVVGSNNHAKMQNRINRLNNKITKMKNYQTEMLAEQLVKENSIIIMENLDISEMKKNPERIDDIKLKKEGKPVPIITKAQRANFTKYYASEEGTAEINKKFEWKHNMNRAINETQLGKLITEIEKRAPKYNTQIVKVDKYFPSTQICSCCGKKNSNVKGFDGLKNRVFTCECGNVMDRDVNAAINIKNEGLRILGLQELVKENDTNVTKAEAV